MVQSVKLIPRFSKNSSTILLSAIGMPWWNQVFTLFSQISLHELPHSTVGVGGLVYQALFSSTYNLP